jgi:RND family efflux transporter MFP subunit
MKTNILILSMFLMIYSLITGCTNGKAGNEEEQQLSMKAVPVRFQMSRKIRHHPVIYASGSLMSSEESKLSFKTAGIIRKIYVTKGQEVTRGQLLAVLDLSEIEAQVRQAEINLEKAERDLTRAGLLYEDTVGTLEDVQNAKTGYDIALAQYNIMEFNRKYSSIYAPANGKILDRYFDENELTSGGQPVFHFASTSKNWVIRAGLTDKEVVKVNLNDSATIRFDAIKEMEYNGIVTQVADAPDNGSRTYEVEITLNNQPSFLKTGFICKIQIHSSEIYELVAVPVSSLVGAQGNKGTVYVVDAKNRASKKEISIFNIVKDEILVLEGIDGNEKVVVDGAGFISENDLLAIN